MFGAYSMSADVHSNQSQNIPTFENYQNRHFTSDK